MAYRLVRKKVKMSFDEWKDTPTIDILLKINDISGKQAAYDYASGIRGYDRTDMVVHNLWKYIFTGFIRGNNDYGVSSYNMLVINHYSTNDIVRILYDGKPKTTHYLHHIILALEAINDTFSGEVAEISTILIEIVNKFMYGGEFIDNKNYVNDLEILINKLKKLIK